MYNLYKILKVNFSFSYPIKYEGEGSQVNLIKVKDATSKEYEINKFRIPNVKYLLKNTDKIKIIDQLSEVPVDQLSDCTILKFDSPALLPEDYTFNEDLVEFDYKLLIPFLSEYMNHIIAKHNMYVFNEFKELVIIRKEEKV